MQRITGILKNEKTVVTVEETNQLYLEQIIPSSILVRHDILWLSFKADQMLGDVPKSSVSM